MSKKRVGGCLVPELGFCSDHQSEVKWNHRSLTGDWCWTDLVSVCPHRLTIAGSGSNLSYSKLLPYCCFEGTNVPSSSAMKIRQFLA
jgi:hypothetical protein